MFSIIGVRRMAMGLAAAFLLTGVVQAKDERETIEPAADKALKAAADYLGGLKSFQTAVTVQQKISAQGNDIDMDSNYDLAVRRPDHFAFVLQDGINGVTIVSNGEKAWQYLPLLKRYTEQDSPESLAELFAAGAAAGGQGPEALIMGLVGSDPYKAMIEGVTGAKVVGEEEVDGVKCQHLQFYQEEMDWELWVETGSKPLIRRFRPDISKAMAGLGELAKGLDMKMDLSINLNEWNTDADLPDDKFTFDPPEGAKLVDTLFDFGDLLGGLGGAAGNTEEPEEEPAEEVHALVGKDAPNFELALLDGESLNLETLKEKKRIVVLDFWATWCPPCVRGLPLVSKVAKSFEKDGVVFVAVNVDEENDAIEEFLKEKKLKIQVALDQGGKVSEQYGVTGIPQTVIIGADGTVQVVHVGFAPGMEDELKADLKSLIAGENLAEKAIESATKSASTEKDDDDSDSSQDSDDDGDDDEDDDDDAADDGDGDDDDDDDDDE